MCWAGEVTLGMRLENLAVTIMGWFSAAEHLCLPVVALNPLSSLLERSPGLGSEGLDLCFYHRLCDFGKSFTLWTSVSPPLKREIITFHSVWELDKMVYGEVFLYTIRLCTRTVWLWCVLHSVFFPCLFYIPYICFLVTLFFLVSGSKVESKWWLICSIFAAGLP